MQSSSGGGGRYSSLVVESSLAMSTFVVTPSLADANAGAVCYHRSLQQHQQRDRRGLCLGSTSPPQLSTCAIPHRSSPLGLSRGFVRGSKLTRRSLQRGPRANSETEERPSRADRNGRAVGGLDELDNQLRVLSSSENLLSSAKDARKGSEEQMPKEEIKKVIWPVFGDGFVLYISAGLILLTIINNILFRVFIGPPVPRDARPQDTGVPPVSQGSQEPNVREEPYKLRSSKDPKYYQNAPPVAEKPSGIER